MKLLALSFTLDGYNYTQVERNDHAAIYRQSRGPELVAYEVIRVRRHDAAEFCGRTVEVGESYPTSAQWGVNGWTVGTLERAREKFADLTQDALIASTGSPSRGEEVPSGTQGGSDANAPRGGQAPEEATHP